MRFFPTDCTIARGHVQNALHLTDAHSNIVSAVYLTGDSQFGRKLSVETDL